MNGFTAVFARATYTVLTTLWNGFTPKLSPAATSFFCSSHLPTLSPFSLKLVAAHCRHTHFGTSSTSSKSATKSTYPTNSSSPASLSLFPKQRNSNSTFSNYLSSLLSLFPLISTKLFNFFSCAPNSGFPYTIWSRFTHPFTVNAVSTFHALS